MGLGATSATQSVRDNRAVSTLATIAWAYLAAQYRSDWARASQVLAEFQLLFNQNRAAILTGQTAAVATQLAGGVPVGQGFDAKTRLALMTSLYAGGVAPSATLSGMPSSAGLLGQWFWTALAPLHSISDADSIWVMDRTVRATPVEEVADTLGAAFFSIVEQVGLPTEATPSGAMARTAPVTPPAVPTSQPLPTPTTFAIPGSVNRPTEHLMWPWVVAGAGAIALGAMIFVVAKKKRRR